MRTVETARSAVDRARAEGYDFSCPRCGSLNSVRVAAYDGGKPEEWCARCFRCDQSFRIKKKVKEEKDVEPMEVYQPQPAQQEAPAPVPAEKPPAKTSLARLREVLTKEEYLRLKAEGKTDKQVIEHFDTHVATFYALKGEWGLINQPAQPAPKPSEPPAKKKPAPPAEASPLEEALQGVACPVPDQRIDELAKTVKYLEAALIALREAALTRTDVEEIVSESGEIANMRECLRFLESDYYRHRHCVGPGHWSGKAET